VVSPATSLFASFANLWTPCAAGRSGAIRGRAHPNVLSIVAGVCREAQGTTMATGTVKFFNTQKGFGFIQQDGGGADAFVHISAVEKAGLRTLNEGDKISFDLVTDTRRGKTSAENLKKL
jgi:CspA family cold shock protein